MALDTNWFKDGNRYISLRDGSDGTLTGAQDAPHATIEGAVNAGTAGDYIIRSGVYAPAPVGDLDILNKNLIGDSENVYIVNETAKLNNIIANGGNNLIENVNIFGVLNIFELNSGNAANNRFRNCTIRNATTVGIKAIGTDRVEKNLFKNITRIKTQVGTTNDQNKFTNNTFINCGIQGQNSDAGTYVRCYFENCTFTESSQVQQTSTENITFQECVFDANSVLFGESVSDILSSASANLNGTKSPDDTIAVSTDVSVNKSSLFTYSFNTPTGGNPRVVTFQNCFWINKNNTNPFNDDSANIEDYTLKAAASGGNQSILYDNGIVIGKYGLSYKPTINTALFPNSDTNVSVTNGTITLTSGANGYAMSADITSGNHIQLPSAVLLTDAIRFFGSGYSFPNDSITVTASAGQLVDQSVYSQGNTDNVRYTFWLKYKDPDTGNIMPNPNQTGNAADWYEIEQGNIFGVEVDNANDKGNGDVDVTIGNLSPIRAKEFQVRIILRNDAN
jgi:hypothetical protein